MQLALGLFKIELKAALDAEDPPEIVLRTTLMACYLHQIFDVVVVSVLLDELLTSLLLDEADELALSVRAALL